MTVTLVATVGADDANSYITVSTADDLAELAFDAAVWADADADDQRRALIQATAQLDVLPWVGERATETQALAWPRTDAVINGRPIPDDEIPREVEQATFDVAVALLQEAASPTAPATGSLIPGIPNSDLKSAKLDVLELEWRTDGLPSNRTTPYGSLLTRVPSLSTTLSGAVTSLGTGGSGLLVGVVRS
jgi:hypothetical protein